MGLIFIFVNNYEADIYINVGILNMSSILNFVTCNISYTLNYCVLALMCSVHKPRQC